MNQIWHYDGYAHNALCLDRQRARKILIIHPLFHEASLMRHSLAQLVRALDAQGIDSHMPDLPGHFESLYPQNQCRLDIWRDALAAYCAQSGLSDMDGSGPAGPELSLEIVAIRGGCLIAADMLNAMDGISCIWQLAPVQGGNILRRLLRAHMISANDTGQNVTMDILQDKGRSDGLALDGFAFSAQLFDELQAASLAESTGENRTDENRIIRRKGDAKPADYRIDCRSLWMESEPGYDPAFVSEMVQILAQPDMDARGDA